MVARVYRRSKMVVIEVPVHRALVARGFRGRPSLWVIFPKILCGVLAYGGSAKIQSHCERARGVVLHRVASRHHEVSRRAALHRDMPATFFRGIARRWRVSIVREAIRHTRSSPIHSENAMSRVRSLFPPPDVDRAQTRRVDPTTTHDESTAKRLVTRKSERFGAVNKCTARLRTRALEGREK